MPFSIFSASEQVFTLSERDANCVFHLQILSETEHSQICYLAYTLYCILPQTCLSLFSGISTNFTKHNKETVIVCFSQRIGLSLAEKMSTAQCHMVRGWLSDVSSQLAALQEDAAWRSLLQWLPWKWSQKGDEGSCWVQWLAAVSQQLNLFMTACWFPSGAKSMHDTWLKETWWKTKNILFGLLKSFCFDNQLY